MTTNQGRLITATPSSSREAGQDIPNPNEQRSLPRGTLTAYHLSDSTTPAGQTSLLDMLRTWCKKSLHTAKKRQGQGHLMEPLQLRVVREPEVSADCRANP